MDTTFKPNAKVSITKSIEKVCTKRQKKSGESLKRLLDE
jgi:hypothetical protein